MVTDKMLTLLQIDSSPMGETSISRELTREFVQRWLKAHPHGKVVSRDLSATNIPVIDAAWIAANLTPQELRTQQQEEILAFSTVLTREVLDADEYVMGVPMHNWGPSSSFKLWADQIVRFGKTIIVTPAGPRGTLEGKRATFFIAAGRHYDPGSANASRNHLGPWLRTFFGNLGVEAMRFVFADGAADVSCGKIGRADFLAPHLESIRALSEENVFG